MDFVNFILDYFTLILDEEKNRVFPTIANLVFSHGNTAAIGVSVLIFARKAKGELKLLGSPNLQLLSPLVSGGTRSGLLSSIIMFISYLGSSFAMHSFSIFESNIMTGAQIYLVFIAMDAITTMFIVFAHTYIRCRFGFTAEWFCKIMIASAIAHLSLYVTFFYYTSESYFHYYTLIAVSFLFVIAVNGGALLCVLVSLMPDKMEKASLNAGEFINTKLTRKTEKAEGGGL